MNDPIITGTGDFTFSAWIKIGASKTQFICGNYGSGNTSGVEFYVHSSNKIKLYLGGNVESASAISSGVWSQVAVTRHSGTCQIYINGNTNGSSVSLTNNIVGSNNFTIGKGSDYDTEAFTDSIANVGIWNRALSASEIESIYWKGQYADLKGTELTNLVSWYDLGSTELGSDLVTNGDFATDSNWTKNTGWSIANGLASCDGSQGGASFFYQDIGIVVGRKYKITFDLSNYSAGSVRVRAGSSASSPGVSGYYNANSSVEVELFGSGSGAIFFFEGTTSFTGSIDNVIVKEIQAPDAQGDNEGSIYGATTLTDAYSASSPFLPRIQDKASDTVANYGEVYGGNAVSFDGSSDYIDTGSSFQSTFRDSFSVSMWVKPDDGQPSAESSFFGTRNSGSEDWIHGNLQTDGDIAFYYKSNGTASEGRTSSAVFPNGSTSWTHIVLIADNSANQLKIFSNGNQLSISGGDLSSITMGDWTSSDELFIGARDNNGTAEKFFDGSINNVKIFNTALTQDQVRELYTKPELTLPAGIASSALKLDMPMQEGSGVAILDGSGNQNHGTGSGITWATGQEYGFQHPLVRSNNPMVFDGSNDYVDFNDIALSGEFTLSAWIRPTSTNGSFPTDKFVVLGDESNADWFRLDDQNTTTLKINNSSLTWDSGATFTVNQWQHLIVVRNSSNSISIYRNGTAYTNNSPSNSSVFTPEFIGRKSTLYFEGMINDVAVWDSALTANEVTALYNSGLPLLPTTDSGNYASADDLVGYWRNDGVTTWTDRTPTDDPELVTNKNFSGWSVESGDAFIIESDGTLTVANTSTDSTIEYSFEAVVGRTYRYNTTFSSQSGTGLLYYIKQPNAGFVSFSPYRWSLTNYDFVAAATGTITLRLYKYGGHTGNGVMATASIIRERGGNNGTVSGSPASIIVPEGLNEGRDSQGYYLTDTDSISSGIRLKGAEYISVQDSETLSFGNGTSDTPMSLEAWIKLEDMTSAGLIWKDEEYRLFLHTDDSLRFNLIDDSASAYIGKKTSSVLSSYLGNWVHIVTTYNGNGTNDGAKIYLNGSAVSIASSTTGTYVAMENKSNPIYLGRYDSNYAKGSIDEAKIYSKELSATEVLKNYNNGKSAHSN